tara:strand:+ start:347745 stop:348827 length:1083 start_codon:yes stop_codon:yes gene_type:complete
MDKKADLRKNLENKVQSLGRSFSTAGFDGYLASALFVASSAQAGSVFALAHNGGAPDHFARSDKYVYLRRLAPEQSIAAEIFSNNDTTLHDSRLFPDEHLCLNLPIMAAGRSSSDVMDKGLLQLVFNKKAALDAQHIIQFVRGQNSFAALPAALAPLLHDAGSMRDEALRVRAPYAPNAVVSFIDISGFSKLSQKLGQYRAQDFAEQFCSAFMKPIAAQYGADLLRYEGDGLWLGVPIEQTGGEQAVQAAIQVSLAMAVHCQAEFSAFARDQGYAFRNTKVKAILELGEVKDYFWSASDESVTSRADDCSGPVFSAIRYAEKKLASRHMHDILLGPELDQARRDSHSTLISAQDFQRFSL